MGNVFSLMAAVLGYTVDRDQLRARISRATLYFGASSLLLEDDNGAIQNRPSWLTRGINPAAVTIISYLQSDSLRSVFSNEGGRQAYA